MEETPLPVHRLKYSIGGTREAPLVDREVSIPIEGLCGDPESDTLVTQIQVYDGWLADVCAQFDQAHANFCLEYGSIVKAPPTDKYLNTMVACMGYMVRNLILPMPSAKYAVAFERIQQLFATAEWGLEPRHTDMLKNQVLADDWKILQEIDSTFRK